MLEDKTIKPHPEEGPSKKGRAGACTGPREHQLLPRSLSWHSSLFSCLKGEKYFPGSWKQSFSINLLFACCFTKIQSDTKQNSEFHIKEDGKIHSARAGHSCLQAKERGTISLGKVSAPPTAALKSTHKSRACSPPQTFESSLARMF